MGEQELNELFRIEFGKQVRESRIRYGLSQEQLAEIMDTCVAYIRRIEQGKTNVHANNFFFLIYFFDIDVKQLQEKYIVPYLSERKKEAKIRISVD